MYTKKRKWILRSIQVLIGMVLMLSVVPAGAHDSGGYYMSGYWDYNNDSCDIDNSHWMAKIPDYKRLSELSIPETHDTMAKTGTGTIYGAFCETQALVLQTQLESGIRSIDIRLQRDGEALKCYHGSCDMGYVFENVLDGVVTFLEAHPSETILMRIAENNCNWFVPFQFDCDIQESPLFIEMIEDALRPYQEWIWTPTNVNPTLGEVRGKIVILEHFSNKPVDDGGDEGNVGMYTSLALDSAGKPHISYYDETNRRLKYAFWTGDFWWFAPVDGGSGNDVGQYTSIAMDEYDHPHISYYDATNGDLKYAYGKNWIDYGQGWDWEISQVDYGSANDVGKYSSLALDKADNPHISYYDANEHDLKYAFWSTDLNSPGWNVQKVDYGSANDVGQYSSLALDRADNPHISYYDNTSGDQMDLKYAFRDSSGAWNVQMLDGGDLNDVGQYSSIALDKEDHAHICYYDNTKGKQDLKCAFWNNDHYNPGLNMQWPEVVGNVGQYTSIALDENNQPHISYYDANSGDLKYAGPSWICSDGVPEITEFGLKDGPPCFMEKV